jgi:hypothetical protein
MVWRFSYSHRRSRSPCESQNILSPYFKGFEKLETFGIRNRILRYPDTNVLKTHKTASLRGNARGVGSLCVSCAYDNGYAVKKRPRKWGFVEYATPHISPVQCAVALTFATGLTSGVWRLKFRRILSPIITLMCILCSAAPPPQHYSNARHNPSIYRDDEGSTFLWNFGPLLPATQFRIPGDNLLDISFRVTAVTTSNVATYRSFSPGIHVCFSGPQN